MKFKFLNTALAGLILSVSCLVNVANAGLISFDSIDNGWYKSDGYHDTSNINTYTGCLSTTYCYNSFYNFDFSNLLQNVTITSASITFHSNGTLISPYSSMNLQLWDVTTVVGTGSSLAVYNDLMSGKKYGNASVFGTGKILMPEVIVDLNLSSIMDMESQQYFSIGASNASAEMNNNMQEIFWSGSGLSSAARIDISYTTDVPEPSTLAIFALGMMGLASRRFKKQS